MRYDIADYIPEEARKAAAAVVYASRTCLGGPADTKGRCPLGVALQAMGLRSHARPIPAEVAALLTAAGLPAGKRVQLAHAANQFTGDFDMWRITDLAEALGVQP